MMISLCKFIGECYVIFWVGLAWSYQVLLSKNDGIWACFWKLSKMDESPIQLFTILIGQMSIFII
jgi:hypothetical protein